MPTVSLLVSRPPVRPPPGQGVQASSKPSPVRFAFASALRSSVVREAGRALRRLSRWTFQECPITRTLLRPVASRSLSVAGQRLFARPWESVAASLCLWSWLIPPGSPLSHLSGAPLTTSGVAGLQPASDAWKAQPAGGLGEVLKEPPRREAGPSIRAAVHTPNMRGAGSGAGRREGPGFEAGSWSRAAGGPFIKLWSARSWKSEDRGGCGFGQRGFGKGVAGRCALLRCKE